MDSRQLSPTITGTRQESPDDGEAIGKLWPGPGSYTLGWWNTKPLCHAVIDRDAEAFPVTIENKTITTPSAMTSPQKAYERTGKVLVARRFRNICRTGAIPFSTADRAGCCSA